MNAQVVFTVIDSKAIRVLVQST